MSTGGRGGPQRELHHAKHDGESVINDEVRKQREKKRRFFDELWRLDEESDNSGRSREEQSEIALIFEACRKTSNSPPKHSSRAVSHPKTTSASPLSHLPAHHSQGSSRLSTKGKEEGKLVKNSRLQSSDIDKSHLERRQTTVANRDKPDKPRIDQQIDSGLINQAAKRIDETTSRSRSSTKVHERISAQAVNTTDQRQRDSRAVKMQASKKRKRDEPVKLVPKARQLFKGLTFFFFPNNDKAGPRRMRIRKSLEYGAKWAQEWEAGITHVIIDDTLVYSDLIKFLAGKPVPEGVFVVNEDYPSSCLQFNFVVNPHQSHFRVKGYPEAKSLAPPVTPQPRHVVQQSDRTFIKGSAAETPKSPASVESVRTVSTPFDSNERSELDTENSIHPVNAGLSSLPEDALSEAIKQTRKYKDLVRFQKAHMIEPVTNMAAASRSIR